MIIVHACVHLSSTSPNQLPTHITSHLPFCPQTLLTIKHNTGMGPIGVKAHLAPFMPTHPVVPTGSLPEQ